MKEIHLVVPDSEAKEIVSFALSAGATLIDEISVPEWQIQETRKRVAHAKDHPDTWLNWDDIKETLIPRANL